MSIALKNALLGAAKVNILDEGKSFVTGKGEANGLNYVSKGFVIGGIAEFRKRSPYVLLKEGSWFGGTNVYQNTEHHFRFVAVEPAIVIHIPGEIVRKLAETHLEIFKLLYFATSEGARDTVDLLFVSYSLDMPQRLAFFLMEMLKAFHQVNGTVPMIPVSQNVLSLILGASRQRINHELHGLAEKGIITITRKRIFINNLSALASLIE